MAIGRPVRRLSHSGESGWWPGTAGADGGGQKWTDLGAVSKAEFIGHIKDDS